jgi:cell division protein ZapE
MTHLGLNKVRSLSDTTQEPNFASVRLVDRFPQLDAQNLVERFTPPPRFDEATFSTYVPDPQFPSQQAAVARLDRFATELAPVTKSKWRSLPTVLKKQKTTPGPKGIYLDGGFGVGKTHLLASVWHAHAKPKAYMTFGELTAFIGFVGMKQAIATFSNHELICIDEFELDDVANTLMVVSFLRGVTTDDNARLAVTSNTLPDRLGEQRFSAQDFRREIAAIANYFNELRIDGGDFRTSHDQPKLFRHKSELERVTNDDFVELVVHLSNIHPSQYGAMLDDTDAVNISGATRLDSQDDALLMVQFVDKLYDARIPVRVTGCSPETIFDGYYRHGGYRKKYGRAESRLNAMLAESDALSF